ncbi:Intracellular protein [Dirofilaria immitis]
MNDVDRLEKALKERTLECDSLKKKVEKFERDRQQWENQKRALEAKQPMDVQMLQGQKRELTMQLDREQAEKQELFLQINSLIAQLADANRDTSDTQEFNILKDENEKLNKQIADILIVQSQLNTDVQNLQEEVQRKSQEVENANDESKKLRSIMNNEKIQLESNIEELQRDLQMKSAELQSLMLAKQDIKTSEADSAMITRLTVENEELRDQINEIENEVKRRVSEIEEVKSENEEKLKNLQSELDSMRENARINEAELSKQSDEIGKLQSELNTVQQNMEKREAELSLMRNNEISQMSELREALEKHKLDAEKISKQLEESQKNLAECEKKYDNLKKDSEAKLMRENDTLTDIKEKFEEEIRQQEIKFNNLKQSLKAEAMKTQEAEQEVKSYRIKFTDLEEELKILRTQIDNQRNIDEQMRMLHEELKQAKHKIVAQATDLEKAEIDADEAERSTRETIDELEEEIRSLQEKLKVLEIGEEKQSKRLLLAEEEMMKSKEISEKYERKCEMLTKDLEEVRAALGDANAILEKFKTENEKLLAKASLEDEVLTLATSLQSARDDISIKHDEIAKLRKELREAHEENKRLLIDIDVQTQTLQQDVQLARSECDKMRTEMEKCKNDGIVQQQKDSLILAGLRNEISKLEEQLVKKEKMLVSLRDDLEMKQQKILLETKQQYEQQIAELNNEMEKLRVSESEKIDELNAVMTNLRKELAVKGGNVASFRNDQYYEIENKEVQKLDLSPRADFEEKLAALKECIADVLEEKLSLEQSDFQQIMINKGTQTEEGIEEGRHIISVNDDDDEEEALKRIDKNVLLLKQEIDHFEHNHADRSYNITDGRIWKSKSSSEVWNLRAELAFLKKQITDEEMDRKHLQNHIQMLQATIQENEEILDLMKEKENDIKTDKYDSEKRSNPFVEQIEKLKVELVNAREYGEHYKREVEERDLDIASLKKDIENLTNDIISCKKRLDESSRLEERNRLIEFENRRLFDECSSLKMKVTKLKNELFEIENENIKKHIDEVNDLNQQLHKARQACELSGAEMDRLREQSDILSKEVNHLRNFLNIANTEKEQLKIEALERLKEVEQLSREQMELEVTRQQLDEAIAESERQAQELARLKVQVKSDEGLERDRQQEIHNLHQQIQTVEEKWKLECEKSETYAQTAKKELEKLTKTNETFVEDIERLTSELEVERKRVTDLGIEKMHLLSEIEQLKNEFDVFKTESMQGEDSPELKRRLSELMAENAHLAGELLKKHNLEDKELSKQNQQMEELLKNDENWKCKEKLLREENREKLKKAMEDFERRLQQCNEEWTIKSNNQMKILKREMDRMNDENEELRSQNERIRKEMDDMRHEVKMNKQALQDSVERLRESDSNFSRLEAGYDTPTPPPRKRTGSEVTADGTLHLSLSEENKKLKKDIEMQHRLIVVLRRKLQSIQQQQRQKSDL